MAYEKPIEIKVVAPNISGTEAKTVEVFNKLERLLSKALPVSDFYKSPSASINTATNEVSKSFFVRKDVEKLVRDTLIANNDLFIQGFSIASKEAKTKRYKVDIEGDRALAALKADTTAHGGQVYSTQKGMYAEVPDYKGARKDAVAKAEEITNKLRIKVAAEANKYLTQEQKDMAEAEAKAIKEANKAKVARAKKEEQETKKWVKLTEAEQDEVDAYLKKESATAGKEAIKAEDEVAREKLARAKLESTMNNKWMKLLYKRDADIAADEARKAAEDEKVKKEVAKFFKKEDDSAAALKARQEAKEAAAEAREKEAHARELKRREAAMFRLITNKEEKEAKEAKREEAKRLREEAKQEKQREKEAEKEKKSAETDAKHRGLTLLAGIGTSILLLKKLVSLVENIMNGVIDAGEKSFKTTMDAMRLNIDPVVLRNLFYAGTAKGIGSAPVDMLTTMQSLFGTTLLAAENVGKIDTMAPVIGKVIGDLMRNGQAGTDPMGMTSAVLDSVLQAYKEGKNALGQKGGTQSSNAASLITMIESSLGESAAQILTRMFQDLDSGKDVSSYQSWITAAMPISSPTNAGVASAAGSYSDYLVAISELKSILDMIKTELSPLLDKLTIAVEYINGFLMRITGNTEGVAELNRKHYDAMQAASIRDKEEVAKLESVEKEYLSRNSAVFPDSESFNTAIDNFSNGILPSNLDDTQLKEFYTIAATALFKRKLQGNLASYGKKEAEYAKNESAYAKGEKTFAFVDADLAQSYAASEKQFKNAMTISDQGGVGFGIQTQAQNKVLSDFEAAKKKLAEAREKEENAAARFNIPFLGALWKNSYSEALVDRTVAENEYNKLKPLAEQIQAKKDAEYTNEDSLALKDSIATALDEASARIIVQGIDKPTEDGKTANVAEVSRDISGNLRVDFFLNEKFLKTAEVKVADTEANSLEAGDTVKIDLYQQSN